MTVLRRLSLLAIVSLVMMLAAINLARGLAKSDTLQVGSASGPLGKIAPWVIEHTANGQQAEFLVVLTDQADLSGAEKLSTKLDKGRFVYEALYKTARATQGPILQWLEARGVEHRAYYIVNLIWVKADRPTAMALANRSDVARLDGNPQIRVLPDRPLSLRGAMSATTQSPPWSRIASPTALAMTPNTVESNIAYVHAPQVWALGYTGQGIVVGGQDTGYDWTHPALQPHYRGWNGITATHDYNWHDSIHDTGSSCGANSPVPCDDYGHGTHTMGTAVGLDSDSGGTNQIGMAPGAKWIGCRNMNDGVGSPATYLECFEFFLAPYPVGGTPAQGDPSKAPDVTDNSWGCPIGPPPGGEGCVVDSLLAAVQAQRAAGIMTVVSAGNSGSSCSTVSDPPAYYDEVYTVGALTTGTDSIASFSSRGPVTIDGSNRRKPDISAPGTDVRSSIPGGSYGNMSGTSMAAPHVAGAVALLWSARPQLKNHIAETEQVLSDSALHIANATCDPPDTTWPNNYYGYGRLDVNAAMYGEAVMPNASTQSTNPGTTITYTLRVTNTAVTTDSIDFNVDSNGWLVHVVPTSSGSLPPNSGLDVTASVDVPDDAPAYLTHTVTIAFASHAVPSRSTDAILTTSVRPFYAFVLTAPLRAETDLPGQVVAYSLWLTNTGNITDDLYVSSRGNQWLSAVIPAQVTLGPRAASTLTAFVLIPLSATHAASDTLRVTVTGTSSSASIELITAGQVFKYYWPMLLKQIQSVRSS